MGARDANGGRHTRQHHPCHGLLARAATVPAANPLCLAGAKSSDAALTQYIETLAACRAVEAVSPTMEAFAGTPEELLACCREQLGLELLLQYWKARRMEPRIVSLALLMRA